MRLSALLIPILMLLISCQKENDDVETYVDFSVSDTLLDTNENLLITNNSDSIDVNYSWFFGDGYTSNERVPNHFYSTPGNYSIKLIVSKKEGKSAQMVRNIRIGDRFVYEIILNTLSQSKWYPEFGPWDEDSTGINALPDVFFLIKESNGPVLHKTNTVFNTSSKNTPMSFSIPDIKISSKGNIGIGSTGIFLSDNDGMISEIIASNLVSGVSCNNQSYSRPYHIGEYTISFNSSFIVKYKIK